VPAGVSVIDGSNVRNIHRQGRHFRRSGANVRCIELWYKCTGKATREEFWRDSSKLGRGVLTPTSILIFDGRTAISNLTIQQMDQRRSTRHTNTRKRAGSSSNDDDRDFKRYRSPPSEDSSEDSSCKRLLLDPTLPRLFIFHCLIDHSPRKPVGSFPLFPRRS